MASTGNTEEVVGLVVKIASESTGFQEQMTTLNRQMKVLQSDYKATASTSKDFENTLTGLASKSAYLNDALKTQQSIVDAHSVRLEKSKQRLLDLANAQLELKTKLDSTKSAYEESIKLHGEEAEETQKLASELKELQAQYDKNNDKVNSLSKTIDNQTISYNNARSTLNSFEAQLKDTESAMEEMKNASNGVASNMDGLKGTGNPFSQFTGGLKEALGETKIFGVSLGDIGGALTGTISPANLMTGAVAGITSALTDLVAQGIQQAIQAICQLVASMVSTGNEFSAQISRLQALTLSTNSAKQGFNDLARELGANTVFSASQAAQAMEYAALAGWKLEDMTKGMPAILNLAAASGEELATISDILTDDLTALGYGTEYATQMADVFAATMANSNTNVEMIGEAMSYAGATAGALGYSMEDVSLAIGLMANSGIKASMAGTSLRKVMTQLAGGVTLSSEAMGEFEINSSNSDGTMKDLRTVIEELRVAFSTMTEEEKAANAEAIGGKTAMSGLLTIVNAAESDYNKLAQAIDNSTGASSKMAEIMVNNVSGQMDMISSKFESIGLSIYSMFEPIMLTVTKFANYFLTTVDTIVGYVSTFVSTITGMISPIYDVVLSVLTTIQSLVIKFLDPIMAAFNQTSANVLSALQGMAEKIIPIISGIGDLLEPIITGMAQMIAAVINVLSGNFSAAWENIKNVFSGGAKDVEREAVKHSDAMAKIAEDGEEETVSITESGALDKYEKLKEVYAEIESETDQHYDNLKLSAEAYANDLTANEEAYSKYRSEKLNEWEREYEETHDTATINGMKKMEQARIAYEEKLDKEIEKDRQAEETKMANRLKMQKQAVDNSVKIYEESQKKQTEATAKQVKEQMSWYEKLGASIKNVFSGVGSSSKSSSSVKIPGYAVGTNSHPGGLAVVGERGPELVNMPKGSSVSTNGDTAAIMKNSMSGVESLLYTLINKVDSLEQTQREMVYQENALIGM